MWQWHARVALKTLLRYGSSVLIFFNQPFWFPRMHCSHQEEHERSTGYNSDPTAPASLVPHPVTQFETQGFGGLQTTSDHTSLSASNTQCESGPTYIIGVEVLSASKQKGV